MIGLDALLHENGEKHWFGMHLRMKTLENLFSIHLCRNMSKNYVFFFDTILQLALSIEW